MASGLFGLLPLLAFAPWAPTQTCPLYVLRDAGELEVVREEIEPDRTRVFAVGGEGGTVAVLLPYATGQSGDLIETAQGGLLVARCRDTRLWVGVLRKGEQSPREIFDRSVDSLAAYDIRANVTTWDNRRAAFRIAGYQSMQRDTTGPVLDFFAGAVDLDQGDYAITLEITRAAALPGVEGEAPIEVVEGYWIVPVVLETGEAGRFIVDVGAPATIVRQGWLPATVATRPGTMTQSSSEGERTLPLEIGTAGGTIGGSLAVARLTTARIGTVVVDSLSVLVVPDLPTIGGAPVDGVLGLDVLRRAGSVAFVFPAGAGGGTMTLRNGMEAGPEAIPFDDVGGHLVLSGDIGGEPLRFIVDTGSPQTVVPHAVARAGGILEAARPVAPLHGLDGAPIAAWESAPTRVGLGSFQRPGLRLLVADLPVFYHFDGGRGVGLLGASFFEKAGRLVIDFRKGEIGLGPERS